MYSRCEKKLENVMWDTAIHGTLPSKPKHSPGGIPNVTCKAKFQKVELIFEKDCDTTWQ